MEESSGSAVALWVDSVALVRLSTADGEFLKEFKDFLEASGIRQIRVNLVAENGTYTGLFASKDATKIKKWFDSQGDKVEVPVKLR